MNLKPFLFLFLLACLIAPAAAAGGAGTAASPYIIETAAELQSIQNNLGAYYRLANDIDLSGVTWTPIGSQSAGFYGSFDGNGKTIKNLDLSTSTQSSGFFGMVTSGAVIKDVTFQDCSITSSKRWAGIVTGSIIMSSGAHETAIISNVDIVRCSISTSAGDVACIAGLIYTYADVEITDCDISYSNVHGNEEVGIIIGAAYSSASAEITNCNVIYSRASSNSNSLGGLVGGCYGQSSIMVDSSTIQNSIIESTGGIGVAGIVGGGSAVGSSVTILNCDVVNCIIIGPNQVGGVNGKVSDCLLNAQTCTVTDCTILATSSYSGGIAGVIGSTSTISDCTVTDSIITAQDYAASICSYVN